MTVVAGQRPKYAKVRDSREREREKGRERNRYVCIFIYVCPCCKLRKPRYCCYFHPKFLEFSVQWSLCVHACLFFVCCACLVCCEQITGKWWIPFHSILFHSISSLFVSVGYDFYARGRFCVFALHPHHRRRHHAPPPAPPRHHHHHFTYLLFICSCCGHTFRPLLFLDDESLVSRDQTRLSWAMMMLVRLHVLSVSLCLFVSRRRVTYEQMARLVPPLCPARKFEPGEELYKEGDIDPTYYLLRKGVVQFSVSTPVGRVPLQSQGPGMSHGDMWWWDSMRRTTVDGVSNRYL